MIRYVCIPSTPCRNSRVIRYHQKHLSIMIFRSRSACCTAPPSTCRPAGGTAAQCSFGRALAIRAFLTTWRETRLIQGQRFHREQQCHLLEFMADYRQGLPFSYALGIHTPVPPSLTVPSPSLQRRDLRPRPRLLPGPLPF